MRQIYAYSFIPQNYLAEEILLGTIILIPRIFPHIITNIQPDFFFLESHQIIYLSIKSIYQENKLNPTELINDLIINQNFNKIGGLDKIINLMSQSQVFIASTYLNIYIQEIIENIKIKYIKRLLIQYGYNIIELASKPSMCSYEIYNKASNYLNITNNKLPKQKLQNFQNIISQILLNTQKNSLPILQTKNYIQSGFIEIDKLTYGLPNGDLIIIAGRPSTGKTSFIINIAIYILKIQNLGVYIFSLEMSHEQIIYKFISIINQIEINKIISNTLTDSQLKKLKETCIYLLNSMLYINDTPNTSIDYIEYTTKLLIHHNNNLHILIIDYLQLIQINNIRHINRVQELSYITRKLKVLAQYTNIPIIVLSQLNRNIETRINKKPLLSDLRESGCILYNLPIEIHLYNIICYKNITYNIFIPYILYKLISIYNIEYIFKIISNQISNLSLTYNHKLLKYNKWYKTSEYLENDILLSSNPKAENIINYLYFTKYLIFNTYQQTYDIGISKYQFYIYNNIFLHNSIEQDADIVMMLYKPNDSNISNEQKIIDVILCKNRNGPIGECHFIFNDHTTTFENLHSHII